MDKKLSKGAYGGVAGKDYIPYITSGSRLGGGAVVLIIAIGLAALFAASTAYSGMKAGLTVAAGIPGSILGSVLIAIFAKKKGLPAKGLMQGSSSGGESIASGMIFVLPAVILVGSQVHFLTGFIIGIGGALFGVGGASLVYNYLIIEEHGQLMYPESMAISETLVASEGAKEPLKFMGIGFGIGGVLTLLTSSFFNVVDNVVSFVHDTGYKWKFQLEVNPMLLGIGFIVGLPVALAMFSGALLSNFVMVPVIGYFSELSKSGASVWNDVSTSIGAMGVDSISGSYVKYIGAGMMLSGGLISAIRLIPTVVSAVRETLHAKSSGKGGGAQELIILIASIVVGFVGGFLIGGNIGMALLGTVLTLVLSLLFVIVSGRLTGTIGTSNLPVSGMTIASIVVLTLVFALIGWKSDADNVALLLFGTFIVTAISAGGGYCQSQKAIFIIGGDKKEMQRYFTIASIVGVAVVTGVIILLSSRMTGNNPDFALPQANLMSTLTKGILNGQLPWAMIIAGVILGIVLFLLRLPVMSVAIGFYLPISTTSIILVGALIRLLIEKSCKSEKEKDARVSRGVSLSSGLVAGGSIIGLIGIILQVLGVINISAIFPQGFFAGNGIAFILLIVLVAATIFALMGKVKNANKD